MVIREFPFKSLFSIVNLISPALSRVQNLLTRQDISFSSKTIAPRPSGSVDTSKTNGDSVCACNKNVYLIEGSLKRVLKKSQLTNESVGFSSGAGVVGSVGISTVGGFDARSGSSGAFVVGSGGISIGGGFDGCSGKTTLDKFFTSKRRDAIPSVWLLFISSLTVNRLFIFSIFSSIVERTRSIWNTQIPSLDKWKTNGNFIIWK